MKSIKPFSVIFVLIASLSLTAQERKQLEDVRGQIERLEADLQKKQNYRVKQRWKPNLKLISYWSPSFCS